MKGGEQWREGGRGAMEGGAMMKGGAMMEGEGGMVWWREGEHWSSPLGLVVAFISSSSVGEGARRPWGIVVIRGSGVVVICWWGVVRVRLRDALVVALVARRGFSVERGGGRSRGWRVVAARGRLSFVGPWLGHRCGGQGVAVRGGVVVRVRLWEVLVVAIEQWWWWLPVVVVVVLNRSWLSWFGCR